MFIHHSDQMSQRSQVSRVTALGGIRTDIGIELSQTKSGQLNKPVNVLNVFSQDIIMDPCLHDVLMNPCSQDVYCDGFINGHVHKIF